MSGPADQILTTAPGTTGQLLRQHNPTNSGSGNSQKSTGTFVVEIPRKETNSDSKKSRRNALRSVLKKLPDISLSDIKVFLDPMLLYYFLSRRVENILYGEHGERNIVFYLSFDQALGLTICSINIFLEFADQFPFGSLRHRLANIKRVLHPDGLPKISIKQLISFCNVCLQIPSSVVLMILCLVSKTLSVFLVMLVLICLRCLKSLFQMHKWYRTSRTAAKSYAWFMLFVVFYAAFSHLLGALWYIQTIFKKEECWNEGLGAKTDDIVNYCSRNTTSFNFGIYRDAHQSGILDTKSVMPKLLYCFRWALQNLSSFGQGLQPDGADILQNIFVIIIIFVSIFLFSFTIGKVQIFLQYNIKRNEMIKKKLEEIEQWSPFKDLSEDLQSEVKNHYEELRYATGSESKNNMFYDLPEDLRQQIIRKLCIDLLKKVEEFERWSELNEELIMDLCDCVKPVFYDEYTIVIPEKGPIDRMIFVLRGTLWTYISRDTTTSFSSTDGSNRRIILKEGDFCGEELVNCLRADPSTWNLPVSDTTIQAVTKVEAFALMAYDLRNIFIKHRKAQTNTSRTRSGQ